MATTDCREPIRSSKMTKPLPSEPPFGRVRAWLCAITGVFILDVAHRSPFPTLTIVGIAGLVAVGLLRLPSGRPTRWFDFALMLVVSAVAGTMLRDPLSRRAHSTSSVRPQVPLIPPVLQMTPASPSDSPSPTSDAAQEPPAHRAPSEKVR